MTWHGYSQEEVSWLKEHIQGTSYEDLTKEFNNRFGTSINQKALKSACSRYGLTNGLNGQFKKGQAPFNKGKSQPFKSEETKAHSLSTCFKKGNRPHNTVPIGSEREEKGYIRVKVDDKYRGKKNWQPKQQFIYEKAFGSIPEGWVVVFIDGDKRNFELENLMAVPRRALVIFCRKYKVTDDPELNRAYWLLARLQAEASYKEKKGKRH